MPPAAGLLARGPWDPSRVRVTWRPDPFEPEPELTEAADVALAALRDRGSPSHDGLAARLSNFAVTGDGLELELQPARWALRLVADPAPQTLSALCAVRDAQGAWLAGRRARWLASWAGRWALGAGGAVEVDENPAYTLARELEEEWSVSAQRLTVEALIANPSGMVLLVGQAWLTPGASVRPDAEHDEFTWWPPDVGAWPPEADAPLRRLGELLSA
jgi:ADP-ribose pyrophosphatase YjhB (NUDIX family)